MDVYIEETQIDLRIATYVQTGHVEKKRRRKRKWRLTGETDSETRLCVLSAGKQFSKLTTEIDCDDSSHKC